MAGIRELVRSAALRVHLLGAVGAAALILSRCAVPVP